MANYKRRHPRRQVKCNMCTDARVGNGYSWNGRRSKLAVRRKTSRKYDGLAEQ